jgi:MFS family permease
MRLNDAAREDASGPAMTAALRVARFRLIWTASVLSNLGLIIQGVGAAWAMTEETGDATLVAMVQSATMLPMLLFTLPAGAMADMYPRRIVALFALTVSLAGVSTLFGLSLAQATTPPALLALSFVAGCGMAFFWPAWQSSASDDVPAELLPAAVGLNSLSYNAARVVGPAVGGLIVAMGGTVIAFGISVLLYLPMVGAQLRPAPRQEIPRLPPERIGRALISGIRYVLHSPAILSIVIRAFILGALGGSAHTLMPLISRDLLASGANVFGILLGTFGAGAVLAVFMAPTLRNRYGADGSASRCIVALGISLAVVGTSRSVPLTAVALLVAGSVWMCVTQACNVSLQMLVPRWVAGRAVACFQASLSGGIALAGVGWGMVAGHFGVGHAFLASGILVALSIVVGRVWPLPEIESTYVVPGESLPNPQVLLPISGRSGPILVEIEYRVPPAEARAFYRMIHDVQLCRKRNGAYGTSIARDLGDPEIWLERYHFPTWHDYLRQRDRMTAAERMLQDDLLAFHAGDRPVRARRFLERPFGSVRWDEDSADHRTPETLPIG